MELREILSELREDRGLTQQELSERLHISNSSISAYETGVRTPNVELLKEFALLFGVTTDYLLGITSDPVSPSVLNEEVSHGVKKSGVLKMIDALTQEQKDSLYNIIESMRFYTEVHNKTARDGVDKK